MFLKFPVPLGDLEYYRKERVLWVSLLVEGVGGGVVVLWRTVCFCLYAIQYKLYPHLFFFDFEVSYNI